MCELSERNQEYLNRTSFRSLDDLDEAISNFPEWDDLQFMFDEEDFYIGRLDPKEIY
jgi:hypothetical protein